MEILLKDGNKGDLLKALPLGVSSILKNVQRYTLHKIMSKAEKVKIILSGLFKVTIF